MAKKHNHYLKRLLLSKSIARGAGSEAFKQVARLSAQALGVDRVGVWRLDEDHDLVYCETQYVLSEKSYRDADGFAQSLYDTFFKSLRRGEVMAVENVAKDSRTLPLVDDYYDPLEIRSVLNIPIIVKKQLVAMLCCEYTDEVRRWVEAEMVFGQTVGGVIAQLICSEQKDIELQETKQKEKEMRLALDSMNDKIVVLNKRGQIIFVNQSWKTFARANGAESPGCFIGVNYLDVCRKSAFGGDGRASEFAAGIERTLSGKVTSFRMDYPCHSPEKERWFQGTVKSRSGYACIVHSNITSRVRSARALASSGKRFRLAFNQPFHAALIVSVEGRVLNANRRTLQGGKFHKRDFVGKPFWELPYWQGSSIWKRKIKGRLARIVKRRESEVFNDEVRAKNGRVFYFESCFSIVRSDDKEFALIFIQIVDHTARKEAENFLRQSESSYRQLFENAPICIQELDNQGRLVRINRACSSVFESLGDRDFCVVNRVCQEDRESVGRFIKEATRGRSRRFELRCEDGSAYQSHLNPLLDDGGAVNRIIAMMQEVTEERENQRKLARSEALYRSIFEQTMVGICRYDAQQRQCLDVNKGYCQLTGYSKDELIGTDLRQVIPVADVGKGDVLYEQLLAGEISSFGREKVFQKKDGSLVHAMTTVSPLWRKGDEPTETVAIIQDISEIKALESKLREALQKLELAVKTARLGIWCADPTTGRLLWNDRNYEIYGTAKDGFDGRIESFWNLIHPEDRARCEKEFGSVENGESFLDVEFRINRPDGEQRFLSASGSSIFDEDDAVIGYFGINSDVTDRKKIERDLRNARDNLEVLVRERTAELEQALEEVTKADAVKSMFLATMSHELRTPLNSIIGFAGLLSQGMVGELNEEQLKHVGVIEQGAWHLLNLINDVLDISKIEADQLEIFESEVGVFEVVEKVVEMIHPEIQQKNLKIEIRLDKRLTRLVTDGHRFEQILINLLTNAIKFTEKGKVSLVSKITKGNATFAVSDTGIGIKRGDYEKVFQPFEQVSAEVELKRQGTGLGLALSQRLARLLGGEIVFESNYGKGSRFTFVLPQSQKHFPK